MAVERAILKTSSLAKLLTGSERRDIRPFGYMRSEGMVYISSYQQDFIFTKVSSTRILIFLKTEIFPLLKYLKNMSPEVV